MSIEWGGSGGDIGTLPAPGSWDFGTGGNGFYTSGGLPGGGRTGGGFPSDWGQGAADPRAPWNTAPIGTGQNGPYVQPSWGAPPKTQPSASDILLPWAINTGLGVYSGLANGAGGGTGSSAGTTTDALNLLASANPSALFGPSPAMRKRKRRVMRLNDLGFPEVKEVEPEEVRPDDQLLG